MAGSEGKDGRGGKERYLRAMLRHPLRRRILRLLADGREVSASDVARELNQPLGEISYHLGLLIKHGALRPTAKEGPAPDLFRWSLEAPWAREMLDEEDERDPD